MGEPIGGVFDEHKQQLQQELCHAPAALPHEEVPPSRWSLERIRGTFAFLQGYSLPGVWSYVRAAGLRLRQGRPQMWSPDPTYREKVNQLLDALRQAREHRRQVVVLFVDEMSYTLWPEASRDWGKQAPAPRPKARRKPAPYKRRRLIGALNALSGRVYYHDELHISGEVAAAFLRRLAKAYRWAQSIYIVWDNWPVHSSEAVKSVLQQLPRLHVISLPTYAPWLNPIEKLWRKFRQDLDYLHRFAQAWDQWQQRLHRFFEQFARRSPSLLRYVGLAGQGLLASALHDP